MNFFEVIESLFVSKITWLIVAVLALIYHYFTLEHDYFKKRGVKFIKPLPFFGNMLSTVLKQNNFADVFNGFYSAYPNEKFIGIFEFMQPTFFIRDPEIIKQISVKNFDHFMNHRISIDENIDPMFGRNLFFMKGQRWKDMRSTLNPAFTLSKMRNMFPLIADCSNNTIEYLHKEANGEPLEIEMKDLFTRFTNDVIATCLFGIEVNSLIDRDNEFYNMGKVITNLNGIQALKFFGFNSFPKLMKFLRISFFNAKTVNFFRKLVHETMEHRENAHIIRLDMINLLMEAKQEKVTHNDDDEMDANIRFASDKESDIGKATSGKIKKWDDDDLTAQCLLFLLAGFDSVSILLCFMAHELAINQDIQDRLYEEVKNIKKQLNGKPLSFEMLQKMKYMDMVVSETLRKWPPNIAADRLCNKEFIMDDGNGTKVKLQPGDGIWLPTYSIHHDPKYYPNPEKFDPERFSEENIDSINPSTYFPYGLGPRYCIGARFGLMESKVIMFHMLSEFRINKSPKTEQPLKLRNDSINLKTINGFSLQLRPLIEK